MGNEKEDDEDHDVVVLLAVGVRVLLVQRAVLSQRAVLRQRVVLL